MKRDARGNYHPEAFCLMQYASKDGSERELIWNSRDGVTPFCILSRSSVEMQHVNWKQDRYVPQHLPRVGDRIFVDLTFERAIETQRQNVERWWDEEEMPMKDDPELGPMGKEGAARHLAHEEMKQFQVNATAEELMEYGAGPPDLVEVTEELLKSLKTMKRPEYRPRRFA
jgi:hypothetical protein